MHTRGLHRALALTVLVAACNDVPSAAPSARPGSSAAAGSSALPASTTGPGASGAAARPIEPTSASKIVDAFAAGAIDEPTAILYRLYAAFGDDRLPDAYLGAWSEDDAAADLARERWGSFSADQQAAILPFMVRPTSPRSWYADRGTAAVPGSATLVSVRSVNVRTAAACQAGFIREQVSPTIPIVVWGQCGGVNESQVLAKVGEVVQYMSDLWEPMTTFMGEPLGDQNVAGDPFADTPEGGDGMLDIYVTDASSTLHGRRLSNAAVASNFEWGPLVGPSGAEASSSYIVASGTGHGGLELKSTLAHEFFHSLQAAHNRRGTRAGGTKLWFVEASAVWAEEEFVPAAAPTEVHKRFTDNFQVTPLGLAVTDGGNEYASFVWPLFMRQELGRDAVANAWRGFEGVKGYERLMGVLDGILSFEGRFRDFAVRAWNEELNPGNPISPRFQGVDPPFPTTQPRDDRLSDGNSLAANGALTFTVDVKPLWSKYWVIEPDAANGSVFFDFSTLFGVEVADVDLILNINGTWQRRAASLYEEEKICDVDYAIVVVSNHSYLPNADIAGGWSARGESNECTATGSWTATLSGPMQGQGTHSGSGMVTCTRTEFGGSYFWGASMIDLTAPFGTMTDWTMASEPGRATLTATVGGLEGGVWVAQTGSLTATVTGSGAPGTNAHVSGTGTFKFGSRPEDPIFTITIAADCGDTYY